MALFTNQAQLSYNNSVTNSNIAVGEILEVLSATKNAVSDTYAPEENVTYIVSIVNSGTMPLTGISLTDNLGAYSFGTGAIVPLTYNLGTVKYYVNGILQPTPAISAGPPLVISNLTIPANGNAMIIYETTVNQYAPQTLNATISNAITITGAGITTITATETIAAEDEPSLSIAKSISPVPVTENGTLTYTFLIQNSGNTAAVGTDLATITDLFNPILTNLNVTFDGETWTEGVEYTYNEATGLFSTTPGEITVPAATYSQDPVTGIWIVTPGVSMLVVSGIV